MTKQQMSEYHIAKKDGQQLGTVTIIQLNEGLQSGIFSLDDLAWKEGTSDWVPLASIVSSSTAATSSVLNVQGASSFVPLPQTTPQTIHVVSSSVPKSAKSLVSASWILLFLSCLGSLLPGLGFAVWIIAGPVLTVTFILSIMSISRGATLQGIMILLATLIVVPLFIFIAPIITTAAAASNLEQNQK
jgi:hypothetical protein